MLATLASECVWDWDKGPVNDNGI